LPRQRKDLCDCRLIHRKAVEEAMHAMNLAWGQVRNAETITEQPTVRARGAIGLRAVVSPR